MFEIESPEPGSALDEQLRREQAKAILDLLTAYKRSIQIESAIQVIKSFVCRALTMMRSTQTRRPKLATSPLPRRSPPVWTAARCATTRGLEAATCTFAAASTGYATSPQAHTST